MPDKTQTQNYWSQRLSPSGKGMSCSRSELSKEIYETEDDKLISAAMVKARKLFDKVTKERAKPRQVLEIALGYGEMTIGLVQECNERGFQFHGIDCSPEVVNNVREKLRQANIDLSNAAIQEGWSNEIDFEEGSIYLITWGRIGQHIPDSEIWAESLRKARNSLELNGYFLQFEVLTDFNEKDKAKPSRHEFTYIRSKREYEDALSPLQIVEMSNIEIADEVYTIAIWQKLS